ncbi:MAG: hypothetical protein ABW217_22605 [Polyangiaceae bacterium]
MKLDELKAWSEDQHPWSELRLSPRDVDELQYSIDSAIRDAVHEALMEHRLVEGKAPEQRPFTGRPADIREKAAQYVEGNAPPEDWRVGQLRLVVKKLTSRIAHLEAQASTRDSHAASVRKTDESVAIKTQERLLSLENAVSFLESRFIESRPFQGVDKQPRITLQQCTENQVRQWHHPTKAAMDAAQHQKMQDAALSKKGP